MSNNALYTIEQVDNKLIITVEAVKPEHPSPTMIRSNDGNTETIEFVNPPLNINTDKVGLDLSKYKPFPEKYRIEKGKSIRGIKVSQSHEYLKQGSIGTIVGDGSTMPKFFLDNNSDYVDQEKKYIYDEIYNLAPLDPSDHPDYKPDQLDLPETRPMNADEIEDWVRRSLCTGFNPNKLTEHINQLVQYELNKAKR